MKKYILAVSLVASAFVALFYSCKKAYTPKASYQIVDSGVAHLKIVDASAFFRQVTGKQDTFNVYLGSSKVTASAISFGGIFPGIVANAYMAVPPGSQSIRLSIPGVVNTDSVTILTLTKSFVAGRYYSLLITDSITNASRDSAQIFVRDLYTPPAPGYINLRFIHAALNDTAGKTVDLFSYARNASVLTKIKPDSVSSFQVLGINPGVSDTFYVRRTGTNQVLAKLLFPATSQRTYTLFYSGDATLASGKKARVLASYAH